MALLRLVNSPYEIVQNKAYLYLLYSKVEEGQIIADTDDAFRPHAAHAGPQASIQLNLPLFVEQ